MHWKCLDAASDGELPKAFQKLTPAERAHAVLVSSCHYLDILSENLETAGQFSLPVVDHALVAYCSIFNSSQKKLDGISKYHADDVFTTQDSKEFHGLLVSYRNKEISHLTDFSKKTWVITTEESREIALHGMHLRDHFCNIFRPGTPNWKLLIAHFEFTRNWFCNEVDSIKEVLKDYLSKKPRSYFDNLPDAPQIPHLVSLLMDELQKK